MRALQALDGSNDWSRVSVARIAREASLPAWRVPGLRMWLEEEGEILAIVPQSEWLALGAHRG